MKKMIRNLTRKKMLAKNVHYCHNMFQKGLGLMFRGASAVKDTGWIFPFNAPRNISITMMFMRFPIDIIFLDEKSLVVDLAENLQPWRFYNSGVLSSKCIELESGTIRKTSTKLGDKIQIR